MKLDIDQKQEINGSESPLEAIGVVSLSIISIYTLQKKPSRSIHTPIENLKLYKGPQ